MTTAAPIANGSLIRGLIREPADVYHAKSRDLLTSHALAEFRRCPLLYRRKQLGIVREPDTTAFLVGRAAHTLILEGRPVFEREYAVGGPVNPKTGNPYGSNTKAFAEWAERLGKPAITDDQTAVIEQMAASVRGHVFARELLAEGVAERVVRCDYEGHACQSRIDWINPVAGRGIVDLKTCDNLATFELDIRSYEYLHQLAFYRALVAVAASLVLPVHIIAVEKREPFRCGVWLISGRALSQAQRDNEEAMRELSRCRRLDVWPTRFESLRLYDRLE